MSYSGDGAYEAASLAASVTVVVSAAAVAPAVDPPAVTTPSPPALPVPSTGFEALQQPIAPGVVLLLGGVALILATRRSRAPRSQPSD